MDSPHVVSREEWLAARQDLLAREQEVTHAKDEVDAARRELPLEYNYKDRETLQREAAYIRSGTDGPGVSVFLREGDRIFHTYSAYERGLDAMLGTYRWLELTPAGRQRYVTEFPHHDTYGTEA